MAGALCVFGASPNCAKWTRAVRVGIFAMQPSNSGSVVTSAAPCCVGEELVEGATDAVVRRKVWISRFWIRRCLKDLVSLDNTGSAAG